MTLKEKIDSTIWVNSNSEVVDKLEQISDEFAVGFAYYLLDKNDKPNGEFTIKELLEIYKKTL